MGDNCGHHKNKKLRKRIKYVSIGVSIFLCIVLLIILITWLVLRPTKPRFVLEDASLRAFNLSSYSDALTSTFQLTVQSHNPNDRIGIYYDHLLVYASYQGQQITLQTVIPSTFQDTYGDNIWSPFLTGVQLPIAPFIGESLKRDEAGGTLLLNVLMEGSVRWKVGTFVSGSYGLHVDCPATFAIGNPNGDGTNAGRYQLAQSCSVRV